MSKSSFVGAGRVVGMLLPVSTETLEVDPILEGAAFERDVWELADAEALFLIEYAPGTTDRLRESRPDSDERSDQPYFLIYRSHWGMKQ